MNYTSTIRKIAPGILKVFRLDAAGDVTGTGSGFLYAKKGILVTCNHVVERAHSVAVKFSDDDEKTFHPAKLVLADPEHDLALLKVDTDREPLAQIGRKAIENIQPGMQVLFAGYPFSLLTLTTHRGILSAKTIDVVGATTFLIDGTVNAGNSGCPLMTTKGEVIGVVNAKRREHSELLNQVEGLTAGAIALHGIDLVKIYQALISNTQLGIGYAVPASYIPQHQEMSKPSIRTRVSRRSPRVKKKKSSKARKN